MQAATESCTCAVGSSCGHKTAPLILREDRHEGKGCTWIAGACYKATLIQSDDHANILLFFNVVQIPAQIQEQSQHQHQE